MCVMCVRVCDVCACVCVHAYVWACMRACVCIHIHMSHKKNMFSIQHRFDGYGCGHMFTSQLFTNSINNISSSMAVLAMQVGFEHKDVRTLNRYMGNTMQTLTG